MTVPPFLPLRLGWLHSASMGGLKGSGRITLEDYLEGERHSEVRHEYIGGEVHAMAGASEEHNLISGNLFAALQSHLKGKPCRGFIHDMKLRLQVAGDDLFLKLPIQPR